MWPVGEAENRPGLWWRKCWTDGFDIPESPRGGLPCSRVIKKVALRNIVCGFFSLSVLIKLTVLN